MAQQVRSSGAHRGVQPRRVIPLVLVFLAVPSWQEGALPRARAGAGRVTTPRSRPARAPETVVARARSVRAPEVATTATARVVRATKLFAVDGSSRMTSGGERSTQSVGAKVAQSVGKAATISAKQELDLIACAQFFVEQQARRRLLGELWKRTPTDVEWATASFTFDYVDADGNGRIEASELAALISSDFDSLAPDIFESFDEDGEGYLDFAGYTRIIAHGRAPAATAKPADSQRSASKTAGAPVLSAELCQLADSLAGECERLSDFAQRLYRGEAALKFLIRANQGMVHQIARQLRPMGRSELDDMLQDGNLGLMQAIIRFEPNSGCRLSTYAYQWIRGLIMTGLHRRLNQVNVPQMVAQDVFKLRKLLGDSSRKILSVEFDELLDFAKQLNWNEDRLRKIVRASSVQTTNCFSLDADVGGGRGEGRECTLGDTMTASGSATSAANGASDFRMTIESVLDKRAERNARIIRLRFGLENGVEHTYAQIASILGLSSQRVCNVVNQELRYLKDMSSLRAFKDGLEDSSP